jgi:hypothetical protein
MKKKHDARDTMPKRCMMDEEGMKLVTPRTKTNSNDASNTLRKIGFAKYVQHKDK